MNINELKEYINNSAKSRTKEVKRLFHGRGKCFEGLEFLCVDSYDKVLFITFYKEIDSSLEEKLLIMLKNFSLEYDYETLILQRRYLKKNVNEILYSNKKEKDFIAIENDLKYKLDLLTYQNIGFFLDMKKGREFVFKNSKNKKVLNLFSYTCSFSVVARSAGASSVVNIDMSKTSLSTGRINHHLNNLDTNNVSFMPHNILKSWNKIKRNGPYDLIIIDPPSFQKGSFEASNDYDKIIKRLKDFSCKDTLVLACLNAPELNSEFIKNIFLKLATEFTYIKRLENMSDLPCIDEKRSLKNLVFKRLSS